MSYDEQVQMWTDEIQDCIVKLDIIDQTLCEQPWIDSEERLTAAKDRAREAVKVIGQALQTLLEAVTRRNNGAK